MRKPLAFLLAFIWIFLTCGHIRASELIPRPAGSLVTGTLPVLVINTADGTAPTDDPGYGTMQLYETDASGALQVTETPVRINIRGNTSKRFPKKSFRLRIVDEAGEKADLSIAGLRTDDDWNLNPMYSDTSKIREAVSYWLWEEMNSCGKAASSSRVSYAEVVLNGSYYGLYGVQERVDRKQVGADKEYGILYKADTNDRPTAEELLSISAASGGEPAPETCRGLELKYCGTEVAQPWLPAAEYMAVLERTVPFESSCLSVENTIDYGLWCILVQAMDGHFKNQFLHCVPDKERYLIYRIPWDLNHTLGDLWDGTSAQTNYLTYETVFPAADDIFRILLEQKNPEICEKIRARWHTLRKDVLTEDRILAFANTLYESLYPAIQQDSLAWPHCGTGEGNAANIRDIELYIRTILPQMDAWTETLIS